MTVTPIVIVEDQALIGMGVSDLFRRSQDQLREQQLEGAVQQVASGRRLLRWLDTQPPKTVRLLLVDYSIVAGEGATLVTQVRDPHSHATIHPALHDQALIIGWSAEVQAEDQFRSAGTDGFISKQRVIGNLIEDILAIKAQREQGETWVSLL